MLALLSGPFLILGFLSEHLFGLPSLVAIAFCGLAYLAGGFNTARHGIKAALHLRFDVDFLMVVAAVAAVLGEWAEGALLLFLFSLGHALEHYAMDRVCSGPPDQLSADRLIERTGCVLASWDTYELLDALRGQHIHLWQDDDAYRILVTGHDEPVKQALAVFARIEAQCHAHATPQLSRDEEGYLFPVRGENAFIFPNCFLPWSRRLHNSVPEACFLLQ